MENRVDYMTPAFASLFIGLLVAAFSQSCSVTKASISKLIVPVESKPDNTVVKPVFKLYTGLSSNMPTIDTSHAFKPSTVSYLDTTNYNKMILSNQELSLLNEKKILDLLVQKDIENKKLKKVNATLSKKTEITKEEKQDAISMQTIWDLGTTIIYLCAVIIGLLLLQTTALFIYYKKNRYKYS